MEYELSVQYVLYKTFMLKNTLPPLRAFSTESLVPPFGSNLTFSREQHSSTFRRALCPLVRGINLLNELSLSCNQDSTRPHLLEQDILEVVDFLNVTILTSWPFWPALSSECLVLKLDWLTRAPHCLYANLEAMRYQAYESSHRFTLLRTRTQAARFFPTISL